jgi:hypothetical protein
LNRASVARTRPAVIERYVFIKLKPEHATPQGRAEARARSEALALIPGVRGLSIGAPADASAESAWDLCLTLRLDSLEGVGSYLEHPEHIAYHEGFLKPRVQVIKAWSFEV